MERPSLLAILIAAWALPVGVLDAQIPTGGRAAPGTDGAVYRVYVGAESADLVHRIRLDAEGVHLEATTGIGELALETEGPHGLNVSPDGAHLYVTTAHGVPDGKLWKLAAGPDTLVGEPTLLGSFPATLDVTPDGLYALVANFNLHGEPVPSTVSVVYTPELLEVDQIPTCTMPHGLRMRPDGLFAYSLCMMDDQLVEIDTRSFEVTRRFGLAEGHEGPIEDYDPGEVLVGSRGMVGAPPRDPDAMGPMAAGAGHGPSCSPTWVQPSPDGTELFVACNRSDEIVVISLEEWRVARRFGAGRAPYNLGVTADGDVLVATLKGAGAVQFLDARTGESLAVVPSTATVTHGVALTPDGRYAFVSVEGKGGEPGKVDVYALDGFRLVGSVEVGQQAGGIVFWRMEPAG